MRLILLFIIFLFSSPGNCQETPTLETKQDSVNLLVKLIEQNGKVTSPATGPLGFGSEQYLRFVFLLEMMSNEELVELVNSSNKCMRVYAYMGLYHNKYNNLTVVQKILESDSTRILTISGCTIEQTTIAEIIPNITHWYWEASTHRIIENHKNSSFFRKEEFRDVISGDD